MLQNGSKHTLWPEISSYGSFMGAGHYQSILDKNFAHIRTGIHNTCIPVVVHPGLKQLRKVHLTISKPVRKDWKLPDIAHMSIPYSRTGLFFHHKEGLVSSLVPLQTASRYHFQMHLKQEKKDAQLISVSFGPPNLFKTKSSLLKN